MRRFIYLDTDTLNSYIAQIYDGLVNRKKHNHKAKLLQTNNLNAHPILKQVLI